MNSFGKFIYLAREGFIDFMGVPYLPAQSNIIQDYLQFNHTSYVNQTKLIINYKITKSTEIVPERSRYNKMNNLV